MKLVSDRTLPALGQNARIDDLTLPVEFGGENAQEVSVSMTCSVRKSRYVKYEDACTGK